MRRICTFVPRLGLSGTFAVRSAIGADPPSSPARAAAEFTGARTGPNQVIVWNRILLRLVEAPGAQPGPIDPTPSLAIMHLAIADAVGAITRRFPPYRLRGNVSRCASPHAATASAAHAVLVALYPGMQPALEAELARSLATIRHGSGKTTGVAIGADAAAATLQLLNRDSLAGAAGPLFALWRADQFRPPPPPAGTTDEYANALAEVRSIGERHSLIRSPDQTEIGRFWSAPIYTYWNEAAHRASLVHHDSVADDARLFALLNLSCADGLTAVRDAQGTYRPSRPATAIREHAIPPDAAWTPLLTGADEPSYPSSHSAVSSAAAAILAQEFGDRFDFAVSSAVAPGVHRRFSGFSAAAEEAGISRIYAGRHFRFDHTAGQRLGRRVAEYVAQLCYYAA